MTEINEYSDYLDSQDEERKQRLTTSIYSSADKTPDSEATLHRIAERSGIPVEALRLDNGTEAKRRIAVEDAETLSARSPQLAEYLSDPENASVSHDDIDNLAATEDMFIKRGAVSTLGMASTGDQELAKGAKKAAGFAFPTAVQSVKTAPLRFAQGVNEALALTGELTGYYALLRGTGIDKDPGAFLRDNLNVYQSHISGIEETRPQTRAQANVKMATDSIATSLLTAPAAVAGRIPQLAAFAVSAPGQLFDYIEAGYHPVQAAAFSAMNKVMEGATEMIGVGKLFHPGSFAKKAGEFAVGDLFGEEINNAYSQLLAKGTIQPDLSLEEFTASAVDTAVVTILAGGVQGAATAPLAAMSSEYQRAAKAQQNMDFMLALGDSAKSAKLLQRMPAKYKEFIQAIKSQGDVENVFIDADKFQTFFQSQGVDPQQMAESIGAAEEYAQALAVGGEMVIPLEDYAMHLAGTDYHAELSKDLRLHPDVMSYREAEQFKGEIPGQLDSLLKEVTEGEGETSSRKVYDDIYQGLTAIGRDDATARMEALIQTSRVNTLAQQQGRDAFEVWQENPIKFKRETFMTRRDFIDTTIDPLLDRLRGKEVPREGKVFGDSALTLLRTKGLQDHPDLESMDIDKDRKPFTRKLIRPEGLTLDAAGELLWEAGYFKERPTEREVLDAIDREMRGDPLYSDKQTDQQALQMSADLEEMQMFLDQNNIDLATMSNLEIRDALAKTMEGETFNQVTPQQARDTNVTLDMPTSAEFKEAISNTPAAELTEEGLLIDVVRYQPHEAGGELAIRTGVFYLPKGSPQEKHYKGGKTGYGGHAKIEGETLLRRPLFAKGGTGGKAPEAAYDQLKGKKAYEAMRSDVLSAVLGWDITQSKKIEATRSILEKYGADANLANDIVMFSQKGNTLAYAIQENIVAHAVREAGYDSVLGYSKGKTGFFLSEIFDVREQTFPINGEESEIHPNFLQFNQSAPDIEKRIAILQGLDKIGSALRGEETYERPTEIELSQVDAGTPRTTGSRDTGRRTPQVFASLSTGNVALDYGKTASDLIDRSRTEGGKPSDYLVQFTAFLNSTAKRSPEALQDILDIAQDLRSSGYTITDKIGMEWSGQFMKAIASEYRKLPTEVDAEVRTLFQSAYHGSPHKFDKFKMSAIGTGEGAQAYGYGLYMAGSREVAEYYRNNVAGQGAEAEKNISAKIAQEYLDGSDGDYFAAADEVRADLKKDWTDKKRLKKALGMLEKQKIPKGRLYHVELAPAEDEYLLWDRPLSEQSEKVKAALEEKHGKFIKAVERVANGERAKDVAMDTGFNSLDLMSGLGGNFYQTLAQRKGSDAKASEYLHSLGIRGIKYLDGTSRGKGEGNFNYVIFSEDDVEITRFEQRMNDDKRASITFLPTHRQIELFKGADASSVIHEFSHSWLEELKRDGQAGVNEQVKADWKIAAKHIGIDPSVASIPVEAHEKFADTGIAYVAEGKAPSVELIPVFQRFKAHLMMLYKRAKIALMPMNDEIRGVFDRLLASREQIAEARRQQSFVPLILTAESAGMTERGFAAYRKAIEKAHLAAEESLQKKLMAEKAREDLIWWKEAEAKMKEEVSKEAQQEPVYAAFQVLATGKTFAGDDAPDGFKISRAALEKIYGKEFVKNLPRWFKKGIGEGMHPDEVAEVFGFSSGDDMIQKMINALPYRQFVDAETARRMLRDHGDMMTDGRLPEEAMKEVHNDLQAEVLHAELKALKTAERQARPAVKAALQDAKAEARAARDEAAASLPPLDAFRTWAADAIGNMPVGKVLPSSYLRAERKAANAAQELYGKQKYAEAAEEKQKQLANMFLYREAVKAQEDEQSAQAFMKRMEKPRAQSVLGLAGREYQDTMNGLLDEYEFKKVTNRELNYRSSLDGLIQRLKENGRDASLIEGVQAGLKRNYRTLSVNELRGVHDMAKFIYHNAKTAHDFLLGEERFGKEIVRQEVIGSIRENAKQTVGSMENDSGLKSIINGVGELITNSFTADTVLFKLDGWKRLGPVYRHIKGIVDEAVASKLLPMQDKAARDIEEIYSVYSPAELREMHSKKFFVPELNGSFTKSEIIEIAHHQGNAGNKEAFVTSRVAVSNGLTQEKVDAMLARYLDERDWNFVQARLDYLESYWTLIEEKQRRIKGIVPGRVQAIPIETPFGTLRGGYYPLKYDSGKSVNAAQDSAEEFFASVRQGRFSWAQTAHGHTIERVGSGGRAVLLKDSTFHSHVNSVIVDLAMGEAINYSANILNDAQIKAAFEDTGTVAVRRYLDVWLTDTAMGEKVGDDVISRFFRYIRTGIAAKSMLFNVGSGLVQYSGILQTAGTIGIGNTVQGLKILLGKPWTGENSVGLQIARMSPFMAKREDTFHKDMMDLISSFKNNAARKFINDYGMLMIKKLQHHVDLATWLAAHYQASNDEKIDADPIAYADRMVARAQGSGIFSDRSAMERGSLGQNVRQNEVVRSMTTLLSYQIAKFNVAAEKVGSTNFKNPLEVIHLASDMMLLYVLDVAMVMLIRGVWPGGDDDDESWLWKLTKKSVSSVLSGIPAMREITSVFEGFGSGGTIGTLGEAMKRVYDQYEQGDIDAPLVKSVNNLGGILFRYPSSAINRFGDALNRDLDGEDVALIEYFIYQEEKK